MRVLLGLATSLLLVAGVPARAQIDGAGSGSTGGTIEGKTNESSMSTRTGADNGGEPVPSGNGKAGNGTGDNAVLNAPREKPPGSQPGSLPSNLNGKYQ
jgi:hypothetical protein